MLHGVDIQPPSSRFSKSIGHQHVLEPDLRTKEGAHNFAQHLLTKSAERLRRGDYYCRRLGVHLSWIGDFGGWWDEITFLETRETLLALTLRRWPARNVQSPPPSALSAGLEPVRRVGPRTVLEGRPLAASTLACPPWSAPQRLDLHVCRVRPLRWRLVGPHTVPALACPERAKPVRSSPNCCDGPFDDHRMPPGSPYANVRARDRACAPSGYLSPAARQEDPCAGSLASPGRTVNYREKER